MMPKIKTIAINGSMLDSHPTGVGTFTYNIINSLSYLLRNNPAYKVVVFSPTKSFIQPDIECRKISSLMQSSKYGKIAAVTRILWNLVFYPIQSRKADIRLSTTTHGSLVSANQLLTIHDLLSLKYGNISKHQRFYFKYLLPKLIKKSSQIIAVSETTKKDIVDLMGCPADKIKVIYNGYDQKQFHSEKNNDYLIEQQYQVRNYLLAVGPTYPHKNFENLLAAYGKLDTDTKNKHPLVIAGGMEPYTSFLKELVRSEGIDVHVKFLGYVPQELMRHLYQEATALVFPSLYEGFGFPLIEAMACGCPIATSNTSSMPEVCANAAIYFDPNSISSIYDSICQILNSEDLRNDLKTKGFEQSKKFSWEKSAIEFKSLIDQHLN